MPKIKKKKNILRLVKDGSIGFFRFLGTKTWFFTVLFFFLILTMSVLVWWQCVYHPYPSTVVLEKLEREKENFDGMRKETADAITLLQNYRENYNNAPEFEGQRELFINLLDEEIIKAAEEKEGEENGDDAEKESEGNEIEETKDITREEMEAVKGSNF